MWRFIEWPWRLRPFSRILVSVLLVLLSFSGLVSAEQDGAEKPFAEAVRSDRASGGFRAFLEIRDGARSLNIVEIMPEGPADRAGLKVGDSIVALDGELLPCWNSDLERVKDIDRLYSAGDVVAVSFKRHSAEAPPAEERAALHETKLILNEMPLETQEELLRWVAIAEQRLADGENLYCHDIRPSESGTHYVCQEGSKSTSKQP